MSLIMLSNKTLSFPHLIEPQVQKKDDGTERRTWSADLIMDPNDPQYAQFMQAVAAVAQEKWKEHANQVLQFIQADRKMRCYGQGTEKVNKKTFQPYDGYVDKVFVTAISDKPPQIIQADGSPVEASNTMAYQMLTRKMYGGCLVNAAVKVWPQDNKHGRGIRCDLIAVQFAGDGTPFGEGAPDVTGLFGAVQAAPAAPAPFGAIPSFLQS